ncbi:MAG: aldehyde dehydrogenase family protein, partial [Planctomycetaceae bacterium]|nr:aldehyde dehydrogenase family protein [Planctomycetaceae bacterium]
MNLIVKNPLNQDVIAELPYETEASLEQKLSQAHIAFEKWRTISLSDRIRIVWQGLEKLRKAEEEIVLNVTRQMGKPLSQ